MLVVSSLQYTLELIPELVKSREKGHKIVADVKAQAEESSIFFFVRKLFYIALDNISEVSTLKRYTRFWRLR